MDKIKMIDIADIKTNLDAGYFWFIVKGNKLYVQDVGNDKRVCLGKFATKFIEDK